MHATRREPTASLRPIRPGDFGVPQARHLLRRAGFGAPEAEAKRLAAIGPREAVDQLLDFQRIEAPPEDIGAFERDIMRPRSPAERAELQRARRAQDEDTVDRFRRLRMQAQRADRRQMRAIQQWWLMRMIDSPRPLEEKMTLFWHSHFATSYRGVESSWHMLMQNRLFRDNATGSFAELLRAIIRDPAMLGWLDNHRSRRQNPNENLARELMELFSLGLGAYSEADVKDGARALTGYSFEHNDFVFRRNWHDGGSKRILGMSGTLDGDDFVQAILEQQACAEFLAAKLYRFFVADLPAHLPDTPRAARTVILSLAATLRSSDYQIKPALRRLFLSQHFYDSANMQSRIKSPAELVVGMVRSLETPVRSVDTLLDAMETMGQRLFFPPSVAGWDGERAWINTSTMYVRQNIAAYLLTGRRPAGRRRRVDQAPYDPAPLLGEAPRDNPDAVCAQLLRAAIGEPVGAALWEQTERFRTLSEFAQRHGPRMTNEHLVALLALIAAAPEFQLC
ncbi:MAG: DUF1800 domain-containing protein [Phycisphaeraceae bacterium]|nr:MAG: DUF1800 domain-containing protein [Phycisphaeraceae bacterium]